jgi:glycine/D-amino acid oxidase-like deaminating enzyme
LCFAPCTLNRLLTCLCVPTRHFIAVKHANAKTEAKSNAGGTAALLFRVETGPCQPVLRSFSEERSMANDVGLEQSSRNWGFVRQQGRDAAELPLMMAGNRIWQGLEKELQADLEWIQGGNLVLAYDQKRLEQFEKWLPLSKEHGLETRLLTSQQLRQLVPAVKSKLLGAMYTPSDGQAEPQKVCPAFQQAAQNKEALFMTGCAVEGIELQNGAVSGVHTERGYIQASTVVCAAGAWSTRLVRPLGVRLPSLWVKGSVAQIAPVQELTAAGVWGRAAFRQRRKLWESKVSILS